jgi:hypothetical protein
MARSAAPNIMRNGQHNSRADFLPSGPIRLVLNHEAAVGTYSLDKVVEELRECGIYPNLGNLLKRVRYELDLAQARSVHYATRCLFAPKERQKTKRLLEDIALISHLIERNRNVDPISIAYELEPRPNVRNHEGPREATQCLMGDLSMLNKKIEQYTSTFQEAKAKGGNHDPLSSWFVVWAFDSWVGLRSEVFKPLVPEEVEWLSKQHRRLFSRLLAAAWRDTGLPLTDHRGHSREPLEDWFIDSLRKRKLIRRQPF